MKSEGDSGREVKHRALTQALSPAPYDPLPPHLVVARRGGGAGAPEPTEEDAEPTRRTVGLLDF